MTDAPAFVSVLVCTRNRPDDLARVVGSLLADASDEVELIVVDQSVDDASERLLQARSDPRVRYVRSATVGKGAAMNEGMRLARAPYVVCTDDDCEAPPGWVHGMARLLSERPRVAVAFCRVVAPTHDARLGYVPEYVPKRPRGLRRPLATSRHRGLGAGMVIRRDMALAIGGIDASFGPGARFPSGDDWDFELRALMLGWCAFETDELSIVHHGFRTYVQGRAHAQRDWLALGAAAAKPVRAGRVWLVLIALYVLAVDGVLPILGDLVRLRRPTGARRVLAFCRGYQMGLLTPVDRATMCYRPG